MNRKKSHAPKKGNSKLKLHNHSVPINRQDIQEATNEESDDYSNDQFEDFRNVNGLHDYKNRYNEVENNEFGFTPDRSYQKTKKPQFLSQQPQRNHNLNNYGGNNISESKLPPSLRWALEEENEQQEDEQMYYERNHKANAHLKPITNLRAPIGSAGVDLYKNGKSNITASANTIYGGHDPSIIDKIPSVKKLSSQKTRRLQPLRR